MRQLHPRSAAAAIVIVAALVGTGHARAGDIDQMRLAAHQLASAERPSGLLDFDYDFLAGDAIGSGRTDIEKTAFIAREADAAYALAKYLAWSKDPSVTATVRRLIATFGSLSMPVGKSSVQRGLETLHILSLPVGRYKLHELLEAQGLLYQPKGAGKLVAYEGSYKTAWAGATALALLAELEYLRATGDNQFAALRASWLDGLRVLHIPGRGFREYPGSIEETPYANGETWLALATYVALFPKDERLSALLSSHDDYVIEKYSAEPELQFYSWGTMAAVQRLATTSDAKFAAFIAAQTRHFLGQEVPTAQQDQNSCAFVEGLAAAAAALAKRGGQPELVQQLTSRIDHEMTRNRALQIAPGLTELDFPSGASVRSAHLVDYAGAYLAGAGALYVRIDVTAHCLSALVEMQGIVANR